MTKIADMHTHSINSHDSTCEIEDMLLSQIEKGTEIFAVTDHFDPPLYMNFDMYAPIKKSYDTVCELKKKYKDKCLVLAGVEICEFFWHPDVARKGHDLLDYDVIIGSVHAVKYKELTEFYAKIDFSLLSDEVLSEYLDAYFDDVITTIEQYDFDILAHLTCPLRYIKGKYKRDIPLLQYRKKIEKIFSLIIEKNIALEVNTSSYEALNDFMPSADILKLYYDMGGRLITLGSDAHKKENASLYFNEAIKTLKTIGFENIYYYEGRKPYPIAIN